MRRLAPHPVSLALLVLGIALCWAVKIAQPGPAQSTACLVPVTSSETCYACVVETESGPRLMRCCCTACVMFCCDAEPAPVEPAGGSDFFGVAPVLPVRPIWSEPSRPLIVAAPRASMAPTPLHAVSTPRRLAALQRWLI